MVIVTDKYNPEENLSQRLQFYEKQFKAAVTYLTCYNGIFNLKNRKIKSYFAKSSSDKDDFVQITVPPGADELE